jgi:hypothetical protein
LRGSLGVKRMREGGRESQASLHREERRQDEKRSRGATSVSRIYLE